MTLGQKIFELRKKINLSQEQLGEEIDVTRQTISNWELDETAPNPEQLKKLSKTLNVSIDELLDNDTRSVLEEKVSNTEKLAGITIKILKGLGILFILLLIIDIVAFAVFGKKVASESKVIEQDIVCSMNNNDYTITVGSDGYLNCVNCSKEIQKDLKEIIDYSDIKLSEKNIRNYFKNHNGTCE